MEGAEQEAPGGQGEAEWGAAGGREKLSREQLGAGRS